LEFFTERELTMQLGFPREQWSIALLKELIDNALDACETVEIAPEITVSETRGTLSVQDNGPGLPFDTLKRSLDYLVRVSDKAYYVSPSRGQLGNALKCLWATPYVLSGGRSGRIDVETAGRRYEVCVQLDQIAQEPKLTLTAYDAIIKTGTRITIHFPDIAMLSV
jgi:DNA topoisomerase VI, subunit B